MPTLLLIGNRDLVWHEHLLHHREFLERRNHQLVLLADPEPPAVAAALLLRLAPCGVPAVTSADADVDNRHTRRRRRKLLRGRR